MRLGWPLKNRSSSTLLSEHAERSNANCLYTCSKSRRSRSSMTLLSMAKRCYPASYSSRLFRSNDVDGAVDSLRRLGRFPSPWTGSKNRSAFETDGSGLAPTYSGVVATEISDNVVFGPRGAGGGVKYHRGHPRRPAMSALPSLTQHNYWYRNPLLLPRTRLRFRHQNVAEG